AATASTNEEQGTRRYLDAALPGVRAECNEETDSFLTVLHPDTCAGRTQCRTTHSASCRACFPTGRNARSGSYQGQGHQDTGSRRTKRRRALTPRSPCIQPYQPCDAPSDDDVRSIRPSSRPYVRKCRRGFMPAVLTSGLFSKYPLVLNRGPGSRPSSAP